MYRQVPTISMMRHRLPNQPCTRRHHCSQKVRPGFPSLSLAKFLRHSECTRANARFSNAALGHCPDARLLLTHHCCDFGLPDWDDIFSLRWRSQSSANRNGSFSSGNNKFGAPRECIHHCRRTAWAWLAWTLWRPGILICFRRDTECCFPGRLEASLDTCKNMDHHILAFVHLSVTLGGTALGLFI